MDNKTLVTTHFDRINQGDLAGAAAFVAEDCKNHNALPTAQGRAGVVSILGKLREAFPDLQQSVQDVIVDGDRAVARVQVTGTHRGHLAFARLPLAPTGKAVSFDQIHIMRIAGGLVVEHWTTLDTLAMFRQLGLSITPAA